MKYLILLLLLVSCSKSYILDMPITKADTTVYVPRTIDTLKVSDVPIEFDVTVENWEE